MSRLSDAEIEALEKLLAAAWPAPWTAHRFEIECPCPNGDDCGDRHTCDEVESREAYPFSPEEPADEGEGQCVVQIAVPGLESLAQPNAEFIAAARNALPSLLEEVRASRSSPGERERAPWYLADGSSVLLPAEEVTRRRKEAAAVLAELVAAEDAEMNGPYTAGGTSRVLAALKRARALLASPSRTDGDASDTGKGGGK